MEYVQSPSTCLSRKLSLDSTAGTRIDINYYLENLENIHSKVYQTPGSLLISLGLAHSENVYELIFAALAFATPLLVFPSFTGVMGLKPDKMAFYVSTGVTLATFLLGKLLLASAYSHFLPIICVVANGVVFFSVHFISNKGFLLVNTTEEAVYLWQPKSQSISVYIEQLIPTPQRILRYSQSKVAQCGAPYILFGAFYCINYTLPYFMWEHTSAEAYNLMLYIRLIGGVFCGLLIIRDKWGQRVLPYLPAFWHFTLLFCIPFTSTVMFLLTQGSVEWLINVAITIMFLIVLVDWRTFFILTILGIGLGMLFYRVAIGPISLQFDFSTGYLLVYQGVFATLIGLLFAHREERRIDRAYSAFQTQEEASRASLLQATEASHQLLKALQGANTQQLLTIAKDLQKISAEGSVAEKLNTIREKLLPVAFQLQTLDTRTLDYLRLKIDDLSIEQLINQVYECLRAKGLAHRVKIQPTTQHTQLVGDAERLIELLVSNIVALSTQSDAQEELPILVGLEDTLLDYPLPDVEKGYIKQVQALRIGVTTAANLPALASSYAPQLGGLDVLAAPKSIELFEQCANGQIIKAHYGYSVVSKHTLLYVIPVDVSEVRPKYMDKPHMALSAAAVRADDRFQGDHIGAQAEEEAFLAAVAERSKADINTVRTALELVKWVHGPIARHSGEPFYLHPVAVAQIVLDYNTDEATILAALLHDTVEDTPVLLKQIGAVFGEETAALVDVVTHLQSIDGSIYKVKLSAEENLRMLERTGHTRGLYVKLADRMHNMLTIDGHHSLDKQKHIAQETLNFFVPMAHQLQLPEAAAELAALCHEVLRK